MSTSPSPRQPFRPGDERAALWQRRRRSNRPVFRSANRCPRQGRWGLARTARNLFDGLGVGSARQSALRAVGPLARRPQAMESVFGERQSGVCRLAFVGVRPSMLEDGDRGAAWNFCRGPEIPSSSSGRSFTPLPGAVWRQVAAHQARRGLSLRCSWRPHTTARLRATQIFRPGQAPTLSALGQGDCPAALRGSGEDRLGHDRLARRQHHHHLAAFEPGSCSTLANFDGSP